MLIPHSIGKTIRRLRKERAMTQEDLALQLNVTAQAVSRWENETCMPDISQIVPIAAVFEVSTDVLFGTSGVTEDEEVQKLIEEALGVVGSPATKDGLLACYEAMQRALLRYPGNIRLLCEYLEVGISLAYPENYLYDRERGHEIYEEMVRAARIVTSYGKNTNDVMRAHMIMVLLHAAYGNTREARAHAAQFPDRADMTSHFMYTSIAHFEKDELRELMHSRWNFFYQLSATINTLMRFAAVQFLAENNGEASYLYRKVLDLEAVVSEGEPFPLALHMGEHGDAYACLAILAVREGDPEQALSYLGKMTDYDIDRLENGTKGRPFVSPLFAGIRFSHVASKERLRHDLLAKLADERLKSLREYPAYQALLTRAKDL